MSIPNNTTPPSTLISTIRENVEISQIRFIKNNSGCDNDITIAEKTVINGITVFIGNDGTHYDPLIHEIILKL
jgi:acyl-[acyl carrier protein]--UDP-N-acetylglucosamine O-acyltransferase